MARCRLTTHKRSFWRSTFGRSTALGYVLFKGLADRQRTGRDLCLGRYQIIANAETQGPYIRSAPGEAGDEMLADMTTAVSSSQELARRVLEDVLIDRAAWTYARMRAGQQHGVDLHEETLTQDLLLDIAAASQPLRVTTFTKPEEALNGADWQWDLWFGGHQWFGLRLQAKRLKLLRSGRPGYGLDYKTARSKFMQVDNLVNDARKSHIEAAYVLYNGPELDLSSFAWGCGRLPEREAFFGVSLLPALAAQRLAYERKLELAHAGELSRLWSCLAACASAACSQELLSDHYDPDFHEGWADTLAMRVALSFHSLQLQSLHLDLSMAGLPPASPQLPERPPPYVRALLDAKTGSAVRLPSRVGAATVFRSD